MVDWPASERCMGFENDLTKAFVSIQFDVAEKALLHLGTPQYFVNHFQMCWQAPRFCSVAGGFSRPLAPTIGVPQGDPVSPKVMALVLAPWQPLIKKAYPSADLWAFVDDRSGKVPSLEVLNGALQLTADFDNSIGLRQNKSKEQIWDHNSQVEHKGKPHVPRCRLPQL